MSHDADFSHSTESVKEYPGVTVLWSILEILFYLRYPGLSWVVSPSLCWAPGSHHSEPRWLRSLIAPLLLSRTDLAELLCRWDSGRVDQVFPVLMPSSGVNWEYGNEFNKTSTDFCFVLRRKALCRPRSPFCAACPFPELSAVVALCSLFWPAETPTWSCWWCLCFQAWCGHLLCTFTCDAMPCSFPKKKKKEKLFCFVRAGNVDLSRNNR